MRKGITALLIVCTTIFSAHGLEKPEIMGKTAITIDVGKNEIIFSKDMDRRMYPASTTKLITAILLAKYKNREDILTYSIQAKAVYPYKLDLKVGTEVKAEFAMDALLLFSANDIAHMIAENIDKTIEQFSFHMNDYAKELGLTNSHFINPSGLHSKKHYSSAYDLSIIARDVFSYPWIMETLGKKQSILHIGNNEVKVKNRNKMVLQKGCVGGKTGWTPEAGRCLVALFEREGRRIVGVVLGSIYNPKDTVVFGDMEKIINYSYEVKKDTIINAYSIVKKIPVSYRIFPFIGPIVSRPVELQIRDSVQAYSCGDTLQIHFTLFPVNIFNLDKTVPQGILTLKQRENLYEYALFPVISSHDILRWDILPFYTAIISLILICLLLIFFVKMVLRIK